MKWCPTDLYSVNDEKLPRRQRDCFHFCRQNVESFYFQLMKAWRYQMDVASSNSSWEKTLLIAALPENEVLLVLTCGSAKALVPNRDSRNFTQIADQQFKLGSGNKRCFDFKYELRETSITFRQFNGRKFWWQLMVRLPCFIESSSQLL